MARVNDFGSSSPMADNGFYETMIVPDDTGNWTFVGEPNCKDEVLPRNQCLTSPVGFLKDSATHIWASPSWSSLGLAATTAGLVAAQQVKESLNRGALRKLLDTSEDIAVSMGRVGAALSGREVQLMAEHERREKALLARRRAAKLDQQVPTLERLGKSDAEVRSAIISAANEGLGDEHGGGQELEDDGDDTEDEDMEVSDAWTKPIYPGSREAEIRERCREIWENIEEGWSRK